MTQIRRFTASDSISDLTQLVRKSYAPLAKMDLRFIGTWQDDERTRSRIAGNECYVVEAAGELIATILLQGPRSADTCEWYGRGDVASFHQFAVDPQHQGQGHGARLLDFAEGRSAEIGAKEFAYDTAEPANHLIQYYRPRGFRFIQHHQWEETNFRSVVMSKALGTPLADGPGFAIKSLPFLFTERLCIGHMASVTPKQMIEFYDRNSEFFNSTRPSSHVDMLAEETWTKRMHHAYEESVAGRNISFVVLARHDPSKVIGTVGLSNITRGPFQACNLGYALDKDSGGQGLMTEALRRVISFAFSDLNLHRLMANHLPENERSARLLARLGFHHEGLAKDYLFLRGNWQDHVLTSLTNPSWHNIFA